MAAKRNATGGTRTKVNELERVTRGLLALNVSVLAEMEKRVGLVPLRALHSLERRGPSQVSELAEDLDLLSSTASRLGDRLAEAGYITRRVSPTNRRATILELSEDGRRVLDELVDLRVQAFGEIVERMAAGDRDALIRGARAFTAIQRERADSAAERNYMIAQNS
jgi:DNA-binding MarR family transcriptional regulator